MNKQVVNLQAFINVLPLHIMHDEAFDGIDFESKVKVARALGLFIDKELPKKLEV